MSIFHCLYYLRYWNLYKRNFLPSLSKYIIGLCTSIDSITHRSLKGLCKTTNRHSGGRLLTIRGLDPLGCEGSFEGFVCRCVWWWNVTSVSRNVRKLIPFVFEGTGYKIKASCSKSKTSRQTISEKMMAILSSRGKANLNLMHHHQPTSPAPLKKKKTPNPPTTPAFRHTQDKLTRPTPLHPHPPPPPKKKTKKTKTNVFRVQPRNHFLGSWVSCDQA